MADLDVEAAVAEATNEENFDVFEYFSESSLPEGIVTLYRDTAAAVRLLEIKATQTANDNREESEGLGITDDVEYVDEDEIAELTQRLKNSAVTFKIRAIAPAARTALEKAARAKNPYVEGGENTGYWEAFNGNLIAKSIVSVTNAKGQQDPNEWTPARVQKFAEITEPSEWAKVFTKTLELNFVSDSIDRAVTADF